jgi:hypothetical protein
VLNWTGLLNKVISPLVMSSKSTPSDSNLLSTFLNTGNLKPRLQSVNFIYTRRFFCPPKGGWSDERHYEDFIPGVKRPGRETDHLFLVPRLKMS